MKAIAQLGKGRIALIDAEEQTMHPMSIKVEVSLVPLLRYDLLKLPIMNIEPMRQL